MRKISEELQVKWPRWSIGVEAEIDSFLSQELRHHTHVAGDLRAQGGIFEWARRTYGALALLADGEAEHASTVPVLDTIREEFGQGTAVFGAVCRQYENAVDSLQAETTRLEAALEGERTRASGLEASVQEVRATNASLRASLQKDRGTIASLRRSLRYLRTARHALFTSEWWILGQRLVPLAGKALLAPCARGLLWLSRRWRTYRDTILLRGSDLFDPVYYVREYPDVASSRMESPAALHSLGLA